VRPQAGNTAKVNNANRNVERMVKSPNYFYATDGSLIPAGNSPIPLFVSRSFTDTAFQYTRPPVRLLQWQSRRFFFKLQALDRFCPTALAKLIHPRL
jgi:hypothetical protein